MPARSKPASSKDQSSATIGFEAKLWLAADKLRNIMNTTDWKGATKPARQGSPKGEHEGANQYFLTQFASAEGKNGGHSSGVRKTAKSSPQDERGGVSQSYTPSFVVRLLVEMLAPYKSHIYNPACGSRGMFVQSENFVQSHGGLLGDISLPLTLSRRSTSLLAGKN